MLADYGDVARLDIPRDIVPNARLRGPEIFNDNQTLATHSLNQKNRKDAVVTTESPAGTRQRSALLLYASTNRSVCCSDNAVQDPYSV